MREREEVQEVLHGEAKGQLAEARAAEAAGGLAVALATSSVSIDIYFLVHCSNIDNSGPASPAIGWKGMPLCGAH